MSLPVVKWSPRRKHMRTPHVFSPVEVSVDTNSARPCTVVKIRSCASRFFRRRASCAMGVEMFCGAHECRDGDTQS
jgi:hypothetical protein